MFFAIQAKLVNRIELDPVNFRAAGRSMADQTFIFSIYLDVQFAYLSIAGVPCDLSACDGLVWVTGWNRVRAGGQDGLRRSIVYWLSPSGITTI